MLGRYFIPLAPFLLIAIHSVLCLFFFLCLEHEIRILKVRAERRDRTHHSDSNELKAQVAEITARLLETEERTGVLVPPAPPKSGLNLNKRSQVIRMSRRGEQAEKIAATLNLPQREVELLLKIYSRVVYNPETAQSQTISTRAIH
jgi:hypothetical protein